MTEQKIVKTVHASDVRALVDAFLLLGKNEILTYAQASELIQKPVSGASSEYQAARERLSRDYGIEIKTVKNVGGQRLDDGGIVEELPRDRAGIRRRVKRSLRKVANVQDYGALSNGQKLEHDRHVASMGIMLELQKPAASRAIDQRVQQGLTKIDVDKLIETLRS